MKLLYTIIAITLLANLGCSSDSKTVTPSVQKNIYADFYIRYLEAEREIKAEASFKSGDELSKARSIVMSNVRFENNEMKTQSLSSQLGGLRHNFRMIGAPKNQYTFEFSKDQLGTFKHIATMDVLTNFAIPENQIHKSKGMTLSWDGAPLKEQQALILLFTNENNKVQSLEVKGPTKKSEVTFSAERLTTLGNGDSRLMIIQKKSDRSVDGKITKFTETEFYSKELDISIK